MLDSKYLGQLILMQSVAGNLPDINSITEFVCSGLTDIPGVNKAEFKRKENKLCGKNQAILPLRLNSSSYGEIIFTISDFSVFQEYRPYLENFLFTLAVIFEERSLRKKNLQHQKLLEDLVKRRTQKLHEEIAERKHFEENLKQSEFRFKALIEQAPDAVYLSNLEGQILLTNAIASQQLGYTQEEILSMTVMDLDPDFDSIDKLTKFWKNLKPSVPTKFTGKHLKKDGSMLPVEINTSMIAIDGEKYLLGYVRDLSEKVKAEQELIANNIKFQTFYNSVNDLFIVHPYQKSGYAKITDVNEICSFRLGYSRDELLSMTVADFTDLKTIQELNNIDFREKVYRAKGRIFQTVFITKDGNRFPVEIHANIVDIKNQPTIISVARDISDRIEAQKTQEELTQRYRLILETSVNGFLLTNTRREIIDVNQAYIDMIGFSREQLCTMNLNELEVAESIENIDARYNQLLNDGSIRFESKQKCKSGRIIDLSFSISVMKQHDSILYAVFCRDITKEKEAEAEIIRQNEVYQHLNSQYLAQNEELIESISRTQQINLELEASRIKAEESDRLKSAFLANMSHEIRTPMNGILGFADLLRSSDISKKKQARYIEIIKKSGERMLNIINDLIDISKIEAGQIVLSPSEFSCHELLDTLYNFFKPEAENKEIKLTLVQNLDLQKSTTWNDKTKLSQVISNLLKNALKFTDKGSIELGCNVNTKNQYEFYVRDTGRGIREEMIPVIFERFRQGEDPLNSGEDGAGLGLSISKAYVQLMGGEIWVESEWEKGSVFKFTIPIREKPEDIILKLETFQPEIVDILPQTILIVEDDEVSYQYLLEILSIYPINIIQATSGNDAINKFQHIPEIDMVLMDIKIPGINGFEACSEIKKIHPRVPVIFQSAFISTEDRRKAREAGCCDFITKPIDKNELLKKMVQYQSHPDQ